MNNPAENKLHEIADVLFGGMSSTTVLPKDTGLYTGQTGIVIFCKHYLRRYPDKAKATLLESYIDSFFDLLMSGTDLYTYCAGLTGALEGLRYLNDEKLLEVDFSDIENSYKKHLFQFSLSNILHRNYDFLHGGTGVVKYFHDDPGFVNQALDALEQTAEKDGQKYKWMSRLGLDEKYGYNIALSHGSASIVSVLCSLSSPGIDFSKRNRIITNACNYILSQEIDSGKYGSCFPSQSLENDPSQEIRWSRMGWCYGDLGIATTLWQAGKLLDNHDWQDKAMEIMTYAAGRRDFQNCGIYDAGLCHGSASICMMFHYMYSQTGNQLFGETRDYWLDCTLKIARSEARLAGYAAWRGEESKYVDDYGVLEGISGIGLMLLAFLSDNPQDAKWMNFFLLN